MDIGIDLGTTYSVICVKGNPAFANEYPDYEDLYLPERDVKIIPTPDGDVTFPSVVWINPENPGDILVGTKAKQMAEKGKVPIMFSKREIGTENTFDVSGTKYSAKDVATIMRKYFKECAEKALGEPVRRAVVTHPAYFDPGQVQETRQAAENAGLSMEQPEQMMMEPAAAALAYTMGIEQDPLRLLTYDLGGGTFDVTVLERREGVINIKAFYGDHLLGGDNFDRALMQWILEKLRATGRIIPYNEDDPIDRGRRAQLLQLAENTKFKLWNEPRDNKPVWIKADDVLVDEQGTKVQINQNITRGTYSELIRSELGKTIHCSFRALMKAMRDSPDWSLPDDLQQENDDLLQRTERDPEMRLQDAVSEALKAELEKHVDRVLLVGGSTYGQWVVQAVDDAFGVESEPFEPDKCVAIGAAILADGLPTAVSAESLELVIVAPHHSSLDLINVSGSVHATGGAELPSGLSAVLLMPSGDELSPCPLNDNHGFFFPDIELVLDESNDFVIRIVDHDGIQKIAGSFCVECSFEGDEETDIVTTLPKPLFIETAAGMEPLAEEGKPLPAKKMSEYSQIWVEPTLMVRVFQEDTPIGKIVVQDIPDDAGPNRKVHLDIEITAKNSIIGTATVVNAEGVEVAKCEVNIDFPPIVVPPLPELKRRHEELEAQRADKEELAQSPTERLRLGGPAKNLSDRIKRSFAELEPDRQEIFRGLAELNLLVNPKADDMDPPQATFFAKLSRCRAMVEAIDDPQVKAIGATLDTIETDGGNAARTRNHHEWAVANENLDHLHSRLERIRDPDNGGGGGGGERELPPTPILKQMAEQAVSGLRARLNAKDTELQTNEDYARIKPRLDEIEKALDNMDEAIEGADDGLPPEQALAILQKFIFNLKPSLERTIQHAGVDV